MRQLLEAPIETGARAKAVEAQELERVIADTTVQEKSIARPAVSRLLDTAERKQVCAARRPKYCSASTAAARG